MPYLARTSNTQIIASNSATIFDLIGTFTQTFAACASLGANWYAVLRNNGTGDITLDPNGSETIDGLTSFVMYPGEARLVQCDGTALRSIVLEGFTKVFTASDNFIKPPGYSQFGGIIRSGGASGSRRAASTSSPGGAGGGAFPFSVSASQLPQSSPVVVGSGGASITTNDTFAALGGDSSFAGITVGMSSAFVGGSVQKNPGGLKGAGFDPSAQEANVTATYGGGSTNDGITPSGSSLFGGAAGGGVSTANTALIAGTSAFGGNGGAASTTAAGSPGAIPSGGGGASRNGFASGAGGRGQVDIWGLV